MDFIEDWSELSSVCFGFWDFWGNKGQQGQIWLQVNADSDYSGYTTVNSGDIGGSEHWRKSLDTADFSLGKKCYGTTSKMTMCLN